MVRVSLRRNGSNKPGVVTSLPGSHDELLSKADRKFVCSGASRVFSSQGDEILKADFECIEPNDVLYFSAGEPWHTPLPDSMMLSNSEAALCLSRPAVAAQLASLLFSGPLPHLQWAVGMSVLVGSCFWMRAWGAYWLWLVQGATPIASLMGLACLVTSADQTAAIGWLAVPAGMYSACWGSMVMTGLYALLIGAGATTAVFWVAVLLKLVLWAVGHRLILQLRSVTMKIADGEPISPMGDWTIGWF
mmetsp:Transcript_43502/g.92575  ORF Transcript_43502/g.92575 Transcript_43502/m.92575 type:complete len:247 (-) Transcript_43502:42-782(-)